MNDKVMGLVFIIFGIMLIIWGYDMYDSVESEVSRAVGAAIPLQAWLGMIGGGINVFVGVLKLK